MCHLVREYDECEADTFSFQDAMFESTSPQYREATRQHHGVNIKIRQAQFPTREHPECKSNAKLLPSDESTCLLAASLSVVACAHRWLLESDWLSLTSFPRPAAAVNFELAGCEKQEKERCHR